MARYPGSTATYGALRGELTNELLTGAWVGRNLRPDLFIVARAQHPPGRRVHVVHLTTSDTFYREKRSLIIGGIIGGPCLDGKLRVGAVEGKGRHSARMEIRANTALIKSKRRPRLMPSSGRVISCVVAG